MPAAYRADYILYIQQLETHHPFLSMFDMHLVSRSWTAGLEYGIRMSKLQNQDSATTSTSTNEEEIQSPSATPSPIALFTWDHVETLLALRAEHQEFLKSLQQSPSPTGEKTVLPTFAQFLYSKGQWSLGDIVMLAQCYFQDQ
jgi:hypothetical protein